MKKVLLALTISGFTLGMATSAMAQATPPAPAAGCCSGVGNGALLNGTGLTAGAAVGLLAVAVVLGVALGDDDDAVITTTTTGTTTGAN